MYIGQLGSTEGFISFHICKMANKFYNNIMPTANNFRHNKVDSFGRILNLYGSTKGGIPFKFKNLRFSQRSSAASDVYRKASPIRFKKCQQS